MDSENIYFLEKMKNRLYQMMKSGDYSDVTFNVDGEEIYCHKNIWASSCLYFDTMFKSGITGKDTKTIEIKTIPKETFQAIIEYIYIGDIELNQENAQCFLEVSDMMQYDELKQKCCVFLMKEIDPSNCFGFLQLSCSLNTPSLEKDAFIYTCNNFHDAASSNEEFFQLDAKTVKSILTYSHINVPSEDFVVEKAIHWMEHSPEERLPVLEEILKLLPLQTVSPQFLQFNVIRNQHIATNPGLVLFLQDVVNHSTFLAPLPLQLQSSFPRTKTEYVEGVLMLSKEFVTMKRSAETRAKISFYRMENESCFSMNRADELNVYVEEESSLCSVDNTVYMSKGPEMLKYDIATKQWTECMQRGVASKHRIFLVEGKRLFSIEYSHYQCPVSEYIFHENKFINRGRLRTKLTTPDFAILEFQGRIYVFGCKRANLDHEQTADMIQVFDMKTNTSKVLDVSLPATMTGMKGLVYKQKGIIMGKDATYIIDMNELDQIAAKQEELPNTPVTQDAPQPMETEPSSSNQLTPTATPELNVLTKPGIQREKYCLEKVGNQLIVMAGVSHHPKFCKEVLVTNIDDMILSENEGFGFDSIWKTVGMLSDQLNRYNISFYKSIAIKFKQNID